MASIPPIVQWMEVVDDEMVLATLWDAGIVQAGDESDQKEFYVWNNRGGSTAVADMLNTMISVRDNSGGTTDGDITKQERAKVLVQMFDHSRDGGNGQWGSFNAQHNWVPNAKIDLMHNPPRDLISVKGTAKGTVSGKANNGRWLDAEDGSELAAEDNFIKLRLSLAANASADAGNIYWRTRISYQFV